MATKINVSFTADQLPTARTGGLYSEIEVPADYEVVLKSVSDYEKEGGRKGWLFLYDCETPSGGSVEFKLHVSFSKAARFKMGEVFTAHGIPVDVEGDYALDPDDCFKNPKIGARIDFPRDKATGMPTSPYREIRWVFPLPDPDAFADDSGIQEEPNDEGVVIEDDVEIL